MKTIDVRVLLPDDVDEQYFVEQLVQVAKGPGAPRGAVQVVNEGYYDEVEPTGRVAVHLDCSWWNGEAIDASRSGTVRPSQVAHVQALARELYPTD